MSDIDQVHDWFLRRGLPLVLTRRVRSRALIVRSAPTISVIGALSALLMLLSEITDGRPDVGNVVRLGVIAAILLIAPFLLYLLHRVDSTLGEAGHRLLALVVIGLFVVMMPVTIRGWSYAAIAEAPTFVIVTLVAICLTYIGFGSIALWAFRFAWGQFGALGSLLARALPLLMITLLAYFSGELWQLAARVSRRRLWEAVGFLALIAIAFIVTTVRDELQDLRDDRAAAADPALLDGTPLADQRDVARTPDRVPLSLAEKFNVVAVMVVSQAIQVVFFTSGMFAFYLLFGIIAIPDDVMVLWSGETTCPSGAPPCAGTWFGIDVPLPQTLLQTSLLVAVISGLYFTVNTNVDPQYRSRFFDPMIADIAVSLAGRDAYLAIED